jgi:hypothetical protein
MPTFSFSFYTNTCTITIDDFNVHCKIGPFLKKEFAFTSIQHYYVWNTKTNMTLYITYMDNAGKIKKVPLASALGDQGFFQLRAYLDEKIPGKSLCHLDEATAFKSLQMANPKKWAPIAACAIIFVILGVVLFPQLRHNFDYGFKEVTLAELLKGDLDTRNVSVIGVPLDYGLVETTTSTRNGSSSTTTSSFIPIGGPDWKEGDPVKVVLQFKEMSDAEYSDALDHEGFTGVIRDIWWEGLSTKHIDFFKSEYNLSFDGTPLLIEVTNEKHNDAYALWIFLGIAGIVIIIVVIAAIKNRKA